MRRFLFLALVFVAAPVFAQSSGQFVRAGDTPSANHVFMTSKQVGDSTHWKKGGKQSGDIYILYNQGDSSCFRLYRTKNAYYKIGHGWTTAPSYNTPLLHFFWADSTDGDNTFFGIHSGNFTMGLHGRMNSNSASYNTGFGINTLRSLTNGYSNDALGGDCLYHVTSGFSNTSMGDSGLNWTTSGYDNTAIGSYVMFWNSVGKYNSAFGVQALRDNTTGSSNTAIGINAGYDIDHKTSNTTGSGNVWIGAFSGSAVPKPLSNAIAIGYQARNTASDQVVLGNPGITSTLLRGTVEVSGAEGSTPLEVTPAKGVAEAALFRIPSGTAGGYIALSDNQKSSRWGALGFGAVLFGKAATDDLFGLSSAGPIALAVGSQKKPGLFIDREGKVFIGSEEGRFETQINTDIRDAFAVSTTNGGVKASIDSSGHLYLDPHGQDNSVGTGRLNDGTATIKTRCITPNSLVFITRTGGTASHFGHLYVVVDKLNASFVVKSTNDLDDSSFNWWIIN